MCPPTNMTLTALQLPKLINTESIDSSATFADLALHERLQLAIDKLGYSHCTAVQKQAIPLILQHKDLLVSAATGSGKTAAFLLPVLHYLLTSSASHSGIRVLILAPTRELARQLHKQVKQLAAFTRIQSGLITGGEDFKYQKALFRKNPEIIIATTGRLLEHLQRNSIDFDALEVLILDEADRLLDMGFGDDIIDIAERCNNQRQTLLFSATLKHRDITGIADKVLRDLEIISLNSIRDPHRDINQQIIPADNDQHKQQLLIWLLANQNFQKALIFTNTKIRADQLRGPLRGQKLPVAVLHGDMEQAARKQVMQRYRQGTFNVLIATDVAARGLDVQGIDLVINFDMARSATDYVHRIGRTGRAGEQGVAISLIKANEWNLMSGIERYLGQQFERRFIAEVAGKYKGPKKLKTSGKAVGNKKKKENKKSPVDKHKMRDKIRKNIGKRRKPTHGTGEAIVQDGGWKPIKKRPLKKDHQ